MFTSKSSLSRSFNPDRSGTLSKIKNTPGRRRLTKWSYSPPAGVRGSALDGLLREFERPCEGTGDRDVALIVSENGVRDAGDIG